MFKNILIALLMLGAVFIIVVRLQPTEFTVTRTAAVSAPPDVVFARVNDFRNWAGWSPWEKMDPAMEKTFEGPASGEGSSYAWSGNKKVGQGKMTLLKSLPPEFIQIRLEFLKPMKATNLAEFTFKPEGQGTTVTWSMSGRNNFVAKAFCLLVNMDKMVGGDFEKGLSQLKSLAEASASNPS